MVGLGASVSHHKAPCLPSTLASVILPRCNFTSSPSCHASNCICSTTCCKHLCRLPDRPRSPEAGCACRHGSRPDLPALGELLDAVVELGGDEHGALALGVHSLDYVKPQAAAPLHAALLQEQDQPARPGRRLLAAPVAPEAWWNAGAADPGWSGLGSASRGRAGVSWLFVCMQGSGALSALCGC